MIIKYFPIGLPARYSYLISSACPHLPPALIDCNMQLILIKESNRFLSLCGIRKLRAYKRNIPEHKHLMRYGDSMLRLTQRRHRAVSAGKVCCENRGAETWIVA